MNPNIKEIEELIKEVPASSIPPGKPEESSTPIKINQNEISADIWANKSIKLLQDYKYGEALALFGNNELSTSVFFKRLGEAIQQTITNELRKGNVSSEFLSDHYEILKSILSLISKEIDKKALQDYDVSSIIASLQGFLINYNKKAK